MKLKDLLKELKKADPESDVIIDIGNYTYLPVSGDIGFGLGEDYNLRTIYGAKHPLVRLKPIED